LARGSPFIVNFTHVVHVIAAADFDLFFLVDFLRGFLRGFLKIILRVILLGALMDAYICKRTQSNV